MTDLANKMIVVVNGQSGSGKTFCANEISTRFGIPSLSQDRIKEHLFDSFGIRRHFRSRQIERASFELMLATADKLLHNCRAVIIESTFDQVKSPPVIAGMAAEHCAEIFQIYLKTDYSTRLRRITQRQKSGQRHAGHWTLKNRIMLPTKLALSTFGYQGSQRHGPLEMSCKSMEVDTTDFGSLDYVKLFQELCCTGTARSGHWQRAISAKQHPCGKGDHMPAPFGHGRIFSEKTVAHPLFE